MFTIFRVCRPRMIAWPTYTCDCWYYSQGRLFFYYLPQTLWNNFFPLGKNFKFCKNEEKNWKETLNSKKKKIIKRSKKKMNKDKMKNEQKRKEINICGEGFVEVLHYGEESFTQT